MAKNKDPQVKVWRCEDGKAHLQLYNITIEEALNLAEELAARFKVARMEVSTK